MQPYAITLHMIEIVTTNEFVTITSTISDKQLVYPRQKLVLTCNTRNSAILVWRSPEYIGLGNQLVFTSTNTLQRTASHGSVTATLDDVTQTMMKSTLYITVSDSSILTSFTISCHNVDHSENASITFHISGKAVQYYV